MRNILIMGAKSKSGQSLLELTLTLPFVVGFVFLAIRFGTAIQISITNQKFARLTALHYSYFSPYYPSRANYQSSFIDKKTNRMVVGIADVPIAETNSRPRAPIHVITRRPSMATSVPDPEQDEPNKRAKVRIRSNVVLCTQPIAIQGSSGWREVNSDTLNEQFTRFDLCKEAL